MYMYMQVTNSFQYENNIYIHVQKRTISTTVKNTNTLVLIIIHTRHIALQSDVDVCA